MWHRRLLADRLPSSGFSLRTTQCGKGAPLGNRTSTASLRGLFPSLLLGNLNCFHISKLPWSVSLITVDLKGFQKDFLLLRVWRPTEGRVPRGKQVDSEGPGHFSTQTLNPSAAKVFSSKGHLQRAIESASRRSEAKFHDGADKLILKDKAISHR